MTIAEIDAETATLNKKLEELRKQKLEIIRQEPIKCTKCGETSALNDWTFIQDHWFTYPRGCNEGDYWNDSPVDLCHIVCPKCSNRKRIYDHPGKERILELTERSKFHVLTIFEKKKDEYEKRNYNPR